MTAKRIPQSPEDIATLKAEIRRIEAEIKPRQEELTYLRRSLATITAGQASAKSRRAATVDRNEKIVAQAREGLIGSYIPYGLLADLSEAHGLSRRQIRRILESAGVLKMRTST